MHVHHELTRPLIRWHTNNVHVQYNTMLCDKHTPSKALRQQLITGYLTWAWS
uniref:Uncharacterized protein n=1 Tax=Anguilla anguilla TaxID=7936 RepID=A0A0E9WTI7_ANGAN